jgi:transposase
VQAVGLALALILGVSGRAMLAALIDGTDDPAVLAELAKGRMRTKRQDLRRAFVGSFSDHHRLLVGHVLGHIDYLDQTIAQITAEVEARLEPHAGKAERLDTSAPRVSARRARSRASGCSSGSASCTLP